MGTYKKYSGMSKVWHGPSRILVNRLCLMTKTDEFVKMRSVYRPVRGSSVIGIILMRFNTIKERNRIIKCENNNNN